MSAFIVDRAHIDLIVSTAVDGPKTTRDVRPDHAWYPPYNATRGAENVIGQMLVDENVKSVPYHYADSAHDGLPGPLSAYYLAPYAHRRLVRRLTTVEALKALDCYEYQACEHPGWATSKAFDFIEALRSRLIGTLPGYDKAPWGFSESDLIGRREKRTRHDQR